MSFNESKNVGVVMGYCGRETFFLCTNLQLDAE